MARGLLPKVYMRVTQRSTRLSYTGALVAMDGDIVTVHFTCKNAQGEVGCVWY